MILTVIVLLFALYPVFADKMPGPIAGLPQSFGDTIAYHIVSAESAFGIPMKAFGEIVVGFIVFGVALNYTGGGRFFNDVAFAMVGHIRGGAAQVGIVSSALQGSISGSVISNVISSGVVTIPAMKRTGFSATYAGAVESVASTGAVLAPPVMGSTAFVMASFLGIPYSEIALAAAIPALLFYFGLMVQVDAYAARRGLKGMRREELPRLRDTMREGWVYILVFAVLIYFMLEENREAMAPFYATALMLAINQVLPRHRMTWARFVEFLAATGRGLAELVAILAGAGFHHRRVLGDGSCRNARQRPGLSRRRLAAHPSRHGRDHELHLRPRPDRHRLLHLPGDRPCAAARQGRAGSAGRASLHHVLGHGVVHHAAGGAGLLRRRADRAVQPDVHRHRVRCAWAAPCISCRFSSC